MPEDRDTQVRLRAYRIWEDEGKPEGKHLDHWSRAETEVRGKDSAGPKEENSNPTGRLPEADPVADKEPG
jgi:hypothetical protein